MHHPYPRRDRALRQLARHHPGPPSLRDPNAYPPGMWRVDTSPLDLEPARKALAAAQRALRGFRALAEPRGRDDLSASRRNGQALEDASEEGGSE